MGRKRTQRRIIRILKKMGIRPFSERLDLSYLVLRQLGFSLSTEREFYILDKYFNSQLAPCGCCWEYKLKPEYESLIALVLKELK